MMMKYRLLGWLALVMLVASLGGGCTGGPGADESLGGSGGVAPSTGGKAASGGGGNSGGQGGASGGPAGSGAANAGGTGGTVTSCGDGELDDGEQCDAGGQSAKCNSNCTKADCGDGILNASAGEDCDDEGESATCNADCTEADCGDGITNASAGEDCDDEGESATCNADCTDAACGDGLKNEAAGEACDDGGESAECDADCTLAECGDLDTNVSAGEECDDDDPDGTHACVTCRNNVCGDAVLLVWVQYVSDDDEWEVCDEGGLTADCTTACTISVCGDGFTNPLAYPYAEDCDDGGRVDGDGCDEYCFSE